MLSLALAFVLSSLALATPAGAQGGALDAPWGSAGSHYRFDLTGSTEFAKDLAIDSQGRILLAFALPDAVNPSIRWPGVLRLTPGGFVDPTFGFLGLWVESLRPLADGSVALAVDATDRPLVAWTFEYDQGGTPNRDWTVRRLTTAGMPDLSKVVAFDLGIGGSGARHDELTDLLVLDDGRVVAGGAAQYADEDWDFAAAVWMGDGADGLTLDPSFSGDGRATVAFDLGASNRDRAEALAAHGGGFVLAGWAAFAFPSGVPGVEMAVCRFDLATGGLDPGFGSAGEVHFAYVPFGGSAWNEQRAWAVVASPAGGLVLVGWAHNPPGTRQLAAVALDDAGLIDLSWGAFGWIVEDLRYPGFPSTPTWSSGWSAAADSLGRLLLVGEISHPTAPSQSRGVAVRLTAAGAMDPDFSGDGRETYALEPVGESTSTAFTGVALIEQGRLAVVGGYMRGLTGGVARSDWDLAAARIVVRPAAIFADALESGDLSGWSDLEP